MKKMENIFWKIVEDVSDEKAIDEYKALGIWNEIVGEKVASVTIPLKVSAGKIIVKVKNSVWRNELIMLKEPMLKKYEEKLGKKVIKDIKFI